MRTVRIGIMGCAKIAEKYAIRAFQAIENAEVVSIASRNEAKAQEWAARFGIKTGESYESQIASPEIDAVYIALPNGLHKEWIVKAAEAGKHIICEKTLTDGWDSAKDAVETCQKNGAVLYENFMCDFHPQHRAVLDLIKNGKIGEPFVFRGHFGYPQLPKENIRNSKDLGGGVLNDIGTYTIFMARKILGAEPTSVTAELLYDGNLGVDNKGVAMLEFPNNTFAQLAFSMNAVYQNNYSLWGSRGMINVKRAYSIPPDMKPQIELVTNENNKEIVQNLDINSANQFELIFHDFCDTVLNKERNSDKIKNIYAGILNQAKVMEAIRLSASQNKKVKLLEIK